MRTTQLEHNESACPLTPDVGADIAKRQRSANFGLMHCSENAYLFDHLIRAGEERRRNVEAERLRCLEIDHKLEFGRLLHRQVGRLLAFENATDIEADLTERVCHTGVVAH